MEKSIAENLHRYPVPGHHVWYIDDDRLIPIDCPSQYFLENKISIEKINLYGIPKEKQQQIYDEVEATVVAHITDPVGANMI